LLTIKNGGLIYSHFQNSSTVLDNVTCLLDDPFHSGTKWKTKPKVC
jgi:hypothetical protein